jgi:hypothetical protein
MNILKLNLPSIKRGGPQVQASAPSEQTQKTPREIQLAIAKRRQFLGDGLKAAV